MRRRALVTHAVAVAVLCSVSRKSLADAELTTPGKTSRFSVRLGNGGELLFIGTAHTSEPTDPQIAEIRALFEAFRPDLLLVEGGRWPEISPPEAAIRTHGELAFAANLGRAMRVRLEDADPPFEGEIAQTVRVHGPDRAKVFYALRMAPQFMRADSADVSTLMDGWLRTKAMQSIADTSLPVTNSRELQAACDTLLPGLGPWPRAGDPKWWRADGGARTWLLDVQTTSSGFRDKHLLDRVASELLAGRRLVVVAGLAHLDALMKNLRQELKRRSEPGA